MSAMTPTETPAEGEMLGADGRALLDAARAGLEPSDTDRRRVRGAITAALAAGAATVGAGATSSAAAASAAVPLGVKLALAVVMLSAAGGGLAYVQRSTTRPATVQRAVAHRTAAQRAPAALPERAPATASPALRAPAAPIAIEAPMPPTTPAPNAAALTPARAHRTAPTAPTALPTAPLTAPAALPTTPLTAPPTAAPTPAPTPTSLDELPAETALLRRAQAALTLHTVAAAREALDALDEHARRFPEGTLAEERDATRALALCVAGRVEAAQSAARSFLAAHPSSPLAHRVRAACPAQ